MKQIGLALHNYMTAIGTMPPGRFNSHIAGNGNCWGAYSQLLGQLDQQTIYNSFNFNLAPELEGSLASAAANSTGASTFINSLLCPTDAAAAVLITVGGENYATHNYDLNVGSNYPVQAFFPAGVTSPFGAFPNGAFYENRGVGPAEFIDGMSNTVAVAETIRSNQSSTYATEPTRVFLVTGDNATTGPPLTSDADYVTYCLSLPATTTQFQATKGVRWHYGAPGHSMYNHRRVPNDPRPDCRGGLPHSNRSDPLWSYLAQHHLAEQPPRRRAGSDGRRARAVHQELHQRDDLAEPRQPQRRRGRQQRRVLTGWPGNPRSWRRGNSPGASPRNLCLRPARPITSWMSRIPRPRIPPPRISSCPPLSSLPGPFSLAWI